MPAVSEKQKRFMDAAAHNPAFAKAAGIPVATAKEFSEKSKGMKFGKGTPSSRAEVQAVNKSKTDHGSSAFFKKGGDTMASKMKMFEKSGKDVEKKGMKEGSKADMALDKKQMMGMKKGGMAESGKADMAQDKAMIKKAFKQHDAQEHKGGKGTELKLKKGGTFRASANGVASKGKTKATQIEMCGGGMYKRK
jgi:hypothetical protein